MNDSRIFKIVLTSILIFLILNVLDEIITTIKQEKFENDVAQININTEIVTYKTPDNLNPYKLEYSPSKKLETININSLANNNVFLSTNYNNEIYYLIPSDIKSCDVPSSEKTTDCLFTTYILVNSKDFFEFVTNKIKSIVTETNNCLTKSVKFCKKKGDEEKINKCLETSTISCSKPRKLMSDFSFVQNTQELHKSLNLGDIYSIYNTPIDIGRSMNINNNNVCADSLSSPLLNNLIVLKSSDNTSFKIGLIDYTDKYNSTKFIGVCTNKVCKLSDKEYKRVCLYDSENDANVLSFTAVSIQ